MGMAFAGVDSAAELFRTVRADALIPPLPGFIERTVDLLNQARRAGGQTSAQAGRPGTSIPQHPSAGGATPRMPNTSSDE